MNEQARAGWYPDGHGNERYWDGSAWTEQIRFPGASDATGAGTSSAKKEGAFSKFGSALKKAAADKQAAKEEVSRKLSEDAQAAGALVTSGVFGTSTVEIYEGGYVRVATGLSNATQPARITKNTPYEKLRSIKFTQTGEDQASSVTSSLEGAVGPAVASLMKGGKALMKGTAPGLAVAGLAHIATAKAGKSFLTVATDKEIHTLTNQSNNGFITTSNKGHNEVGLALVAAANAVLGVVEVEVAALEPGSESRSGAESQPVGVNQGAAAPTLAERLRELADLHKEGILSEEEFGAAKAKLLGEL